MVPLPSSPVRLRWLLFCDYLLFHHSFYFFQIVRLNLSCMFFSLLFFLLFFLFFLFFVLLPFSFLFFFCLISAAFRPGVQMDARWDGLGRELITYGVGQVIPARSVGTVAEQDRVYPVLRTLFGHQGPSLADD